MSTTSAGKVVVITGARSGLGEATARLLAAAMRQPEEVDVNEILFRPTRQEF